MLLLETIGALSYFTHKITLLNCVEINDQSKLLLIFPKLFSVLQLRMDTLEEFLIAYKHVPVERPVTELGNEIVNQMCLDAAMQSNCYVAGNVALQTHLNGITHEGHFENLMVLLTDVTNDASTATMADLPTNLDALNIMRRTSQHRSEEE